MADGGYYAIKGFSFQLDKAILELLNSHDENNPICIEQIQDINDNDYIMQVKYKETQDYSDFKIKEPVLQLIEEFRKDSSKCYKLYCHFKDKSEYVETIDLERLNSILKLSTGKTKVASKLNRRINSLDSELKYSFVQKFQLIYAPDYDSQFNMVLTRLLEISILGKMDEDLAVFYYSNIVDFLKRIIINNANPQNRTCTQKQIKDFLKDSKRLIFNASFKEYKGEKEFLNFVKSKYVKARRNQKNLVLFGEIENDRSIQMDKLIIDIVERYFKKATHDIEPLTFILPDDIVNDVKKGLLSVDLLFNDGYENIHFNEKLFKMAAIKTRKNLGGKASESLDQISFKIRILSKSQFEKIENQLPYKMIYYFGAEIIDHLNSSSFQKFDQLSTKQIHDIFSF